MQVVFPRHRLILAAGLGVAAQVEGEADAAERGNGACARQVLLLAAAPAVDQQRGRRARLLRRRDQRAIDAAAVDRRSRSPQSRSSMRLHGGVLRERARRGVDAAEVHPRPRGERARPCTSRRARGTARRRGMPQRRNFRAARAADSPGLLEHAGIPSPARVASAAHVVVPPRGEQAGKLRRGGIERARLADGHAYLAVHGAVPGPVINAHDASPTRRRPPPWPWLSVVL